jgi:hypothetical protein
LKLGVSQRINSGASIVHNIYINDLSLRINSVLEPILFADDTSVIISSRNFEDYTFLGYYTAGSGNFEDYCSLSNLVLI